MTDHVLVPVDGSPLSLRALRHALRTFPGATVTVLHVVDLFEPEYGEREVDGTYEPLPGTDAWYERADTVADAVLAEAEAVAAEYDRSVRTASEIGEPERLIVDYAAEEEVDHVVLGVHGRAAEGRPLFGSVADTVARRAPTPVTLLR